MATHVFQQGVNGYTGTSDTMLRESRPTKSHAGDPNVNIDGVDSAGLHNQGLLQFDDIFGSGPGQIPVGAVITSATLTLSVSDGTSEGSALHRMLTDWAALSSWTWNSLVAGVQANGTEAAATADASLASIGTGVRSINVTQSLQAWSNGAENFGWVFLMGGSNGWDFSSSEGPVAPRLTVDYIATLPAGLVVTESGGSTSVTEGGQGDSILVALNSAPTANVTITIPGNADVGISPATLTFTPGNWQTAQSVALAAVNDTLVEGTEIKTVTLSSSSADLAYDGLRPSVSTTILDDDTPPSPAGLVVTQSGGSTSVTEGGQGDSILVALNSAPTANVTITIPGNADVGISPATLTFTPGNWQTAQSVALAAVNDTLVEGSEIQTVTLSSSSTDTGYGGLSASVNVGVSDNDVPPPVVVAVHDATQYKLGDPSHTGCCDPSGLAYVPGLDRLFIADSEHDESPFNSPTNLFSVTLKGEQTTSQPPSYSLTGFSKEPTGLEYNALNGYLYITDDDTRKVFWVNPSNPSVKVGEFSLQSFGILDAEDPEFDQNGNMYILNGVTKQIFEFTPNGSSFTLVRSVALPSVITDAEGLAYDAARDVFYIASGATRGKIFTVDHDMNLLSTLDLLDAAAYRNPITGSKPKIKGLELAPSSNPNDGDNLSLYAVDYGADQVADGRLFEIDLHPDWPLA